MKKTNTDPHDLSRLQKPIRAFSSLVLLTVLVAVLVACGGDNAAPAATTAPPAEATAETAATEPTAIPAATDIPATEVPPEPTNPPEPTTAPEPTNPPAPAGVSGACDNPFFPIVEGRVLRYRNTIPGIDVSEYTMTYSDVTDSSFVGTITTSDGEMIIQEWTCQDGGLLSPQLLQLPGGAEGISVEYSNLEGLTLPSADQMRPGGSWITSYTATATIADPDSETSMTMTQVTNMTNTVTGIESVTVPAGTYSEAVRVDTTGTINMSMAIGDQTSPMSDIEMSYTSWYVEGVGLVRQEMGGLFGEGEENNSVTELVAIE